MTFQPAPASLCPPGQAGKGHILPPPNSGLQSQRHCGSQDGPQGPSPELQVEDRRCGEGTGLGGHGHALL